MQVPSKVWRKREEMPHPLYSCGKHGHHALFAASWPGESARSRVLFIHERNSGKRFMIYSGADVSAIPPNLADRQRLNSGFTLQAVNRTSIKTYCQRMLKLDLRLRRSFPHVFAVADVPHPIIGAAFLERFNLGVVTRTNRLSYTLPQSIR